ncbi:hypothetical protein [Sphingomonas oryzagri]
MNKPIGASTGGIPRVQVGVILTVAIMSSLMSSLLPVLLGGLMREGRLSASQIGQAATLELVAMGIASAVAGAYLPPRRVRRIGFLAGVLLVVANGMTMIATGGGVLAARSVSGIGCGLFVWVLVNFFIRSERPSKWVGVYLLLQSTVSLLCSWLFTTWLIPHFGINGCFGALAGLSSVLALLSQSLPRFFTPLGGPGHAFRIPPLTGALALAIAFFYSAGVLAIWAYAEALLRQAGVAQLWASRIFATGFTMQILGAGVACVIGYRLAPARVLVVASLGAILCGIVLGKGSTVTADLLAVGCFSFLWMLAVPQVTPFVIASDPSRVAALQTGSAQAIGYAAGPALASIVVSGANVSPAVWVGGLCFALSLLALGLLNSVSNHSTIGRINVSHLAD